MPPLLFWKNWTTLYQRLFWVGILFAFLSFSFLGISILLSPGPVFTPDHFQELEPQEIAVHSFQQGTVPLTITGENYLVFDHIVGAALHPNVQGSCVYLGLLAIGIIILLSVLTTITRFWFYMGMGLFILCVVSFRLDTLELFGLTNKFPIVILLLIYSLAGYYFQFMRPAASFIQRLTTFFSITLIFGILIVLFSRISQPLYFLSANSMAGLILTVLFIFTVAHEIIAAFIFALTRSQKPTRSLQHFLIISVIYLANLGLVYAGKRHLIEWNIFPFGLFLLITVSGILGLWGFRHREPQYESIMRADPFGTYFFMAWGAIAFSTMGYFITTANDPVVQFLQDAILYSHIGYGAVFFIYIVANFISPLGANMPVYKVLYKPATMPYFTFRIAGLIATFAFFAYSNWQVSLNQTYAGYYNALGDYSLAQDTLIPAEGYYQRSVFYATRNYHAHYALAELDASRWEFKKEKEEMERLANGRPLDLAYLNYSQIYELSGAWEEAGQVLHMGLQDFPKNGFLQNALGLIYAKQEKEDSAMMMINVARNSSLAKEAASANLMALSAKFRVAFPADSLLELLNSKQPEIYSNAMALATLQGKTLPLKTDLLADTVLNEASAALLNNYVLNNLHQVDTVMISGILAIARKPSNTNFKNVLLPAIAHAYYEDGQIAKAFKFMHEAAFMGQQPKCYDILGLWTLEQSAPQHATSYFDQALTKNFHQAYFHRALSLTESNDFTAALIAWDSVTSSHDTMNKKEAERMKALLTISAKDALTLSDEEKFEFSRHRFTLLAQEDFVQFVNTISSQDLKARAIVDRCRKLEEADETELLLSMLVVAKGLRFSDQHLLEEVFHLNLRFTARQGNWGLLKKQLVSGIHFEGFDKWEKSYAEALLNEQAGNLEAAGKKFEFLATVNPFFEDAVIAAAQFEANHSPDKLKPYTILINALDINPYSVKLLKAYFVQAAHLDFDESAKETLDKLKTLLSRDAFIKFAKENQDIFEITQN